MLHTIPKPNHAFHPLNRCIIVRRIESVAIRIIYRVINLFVERIERTKDGIFRQKIKQVFYSAVYLDAAAKFFGQLKISQGEPG